MLADPQAVAAAYADWVRKGGLAAETKRAYEARARAFCDWLTTQASDPAVTVGRHDATKVFSDPNARDFAVRDYRDHLARSGRAPRGVDAAVVGAVRLSVWMGVEPPRQSLQTASVNHPAPNRVSQDDCRLLLRAAQVRGPRDLAIVAFGLFAGLRVGELHCLNLDDIHTQHDQGRVVVHGKGGRVRQLALGADLRRVHNTWVRERSLLPAARDERALFLSRTGGRLSIRSLHEVVVNVGEAAGVRGLHPHLLRHTMARAHLEAGAPITDVQALLGHASVATTQVYTAPSEEDLRRAADRFSLDW